MDLERAKWVDLSVSVPPVEGAASGQSLGSGRGKRGSAFLVIDVMRLERKTSGFQVGGVGLYSVSGWGKELTSEKRGETNSNPLVEGI